ncbi:MAG: hypothetical protein OXL98_04775 [Acidimicrobiaceae bacterium]|nr:hypothetical protein [Acidimicrobiaceae bacterium]
MAGDLTPEGYLSRVADRELESALGDRAGSQLLLRLRDRVDTDQMGRPSALIVITATGYGFKHRAGVQIASIAHPSAPDRTSLTSRGCQAVSDCAVRQWAIGPNWAACSRPK